MVLKKIKIGVRLAIFFIFPIYMGETVANTFDYRVIKSVSGNLENYTCKSKGYSKIITITATQDEIEPASFILCNFTFNQSSVVFKGTVFTSNKKLSESIDIRYVKTWYQAGGAWEEHWKTKGVKKLVPELLLKDPTLVKSDHITKKNYVKIYSENEYEYSDVSIPIIESKMVAPTIENFLVNDSEELQPVVLKPGEQQQYWLTLNSYGIQPGFYKGIVELSIDENELIIPIEITILPIKLKKTQIVHSIYYRGVLSPYDKGTISSDVKNKQQLRADFLNLKSHGIKNPSVYQPLRAKKKWSSYSEFELKKAMKEYFNIRREAGFTNNNLYYLGLTTGTSISNRAVSSVINAYKKIMVIAKKYNFKQVYIYGSDEAKGKKMLSQTKVWKAVKAEGGKIFVAGSKGHIDLMGRYTDLLIYRDEIKRSELRTMYEHGNKVYKYHDPKSGPENPELFRYKRGLYLWQKGFDGAMDYAYQHSMGFIWNDFDYKRYRDLAFTYPTATGVIDTLAWEGYREGIDDLNYIATLEDLLREVGESTDSTNKRVISDAHSFLANLKTSEMVNLEKYRKITISHIKKLLKLKEVSEPLG